MYLVPRLFALTLYVVLLFSAYYNIAKGTRLRVRNTLIIYLFLLCVMAFFYAPMTSADLYRLLPIMNGYAEKSIREILELISIQSISTPGVPIFYYFIGKLGYNGALPAATALITYGFIFHIMYDCYIKNRIRSKDLAIVLLMFMSRGIFLIVISNVRTGISLSIIAWCIYQEVANNRSIINDIPLYIVAASFHSLGQALIIIRVMLILLETDNGKISIRRFISFIVFLLAVFALAEKFNIFNHLLGKTDSYYEKSVNDEGYYYIWEVLFNYYALAMYYQLVRFKRKIMISNNIEARDDSLNQMFRIFKFLILFDAISYFIEYNFFYRLGWFITMLAVPSAMLLLKESENTRFHASIYNFILIGSVVLLFLECARGDLCGLKLW